MKKEKNPMFFLTKKRKKQRKRKTKIRTNKLHSPPYWLSQGSEDEKSYDCKTLGGVVVVVVVVVVFL